MRAVVIHGPRDLRIDKRIPGGQADQALDAEQVRIRIEAGGICGSDLHYFNHGGFGNVRLKEPMILGHEVSGLVEDVGSKVDNLQVGERVAVSPSRACGQCNYCQAGLQNHCVDMRFYGSAMRFPHVQGAFRESLVADRTQCFSVGTEMSAAEAAMAEPLAVCLHAARRAGPLLGKRVLVTGCGPIGILCAMAARRGGAIEIVATDIAPEPLKVMGQLAADITLDTAMTPDALSTYSRVGGTFDVMFEAAGQAAAIVHAMVALKPRATIVQVGLGGDGNLPLNAIVAKELNLKGTFRFHEE
ncbi:MAG: L-idonate 5-dehydrogenase, partial [Hyphomicrobiaceae bacterium]